MNSFSTTLQVAYARHRPYAYRVNEIVARLDRVEGIPEDAVHIIHELLEVVAASEKDRKG